MEDQLVAFVTIIWFVKRVTSGRGTAYHSGVERETKSLVFCDCFVDYCLSFFFWPLYCLSFTVSDSPFAIFQTFLGEADSNVTKLTDEDGC
jgi:hypothetical protein